MEEEDKKVDSGNNEDFSNDSSTSNDKNDDEIVIDFSKVTKLFKRKNKSENAKDSSKIEQEVKEFKEETEDKAQEIKGEIEEKIQTDKKEIKELDKEIESKQEEEKKLKEEIKELEKEKKQTEAIEKSTEIIKEQEEDEIAIDLSEIKNKAKNIFKGFKKKAKEEIKSLKDEEGRESKKEKDDEISFDFKKVTSFTKKNSRWLIPLVLIFLAIFVSSYFRMMPSYLPITDGWAENTVHDYYQNQISSQINQQYPNLPEQNRKALISKEFQNVLKENKEQIKKDISQISKQFKGNYQDENGETYLLAIDPYLWYSQARNVINHGHLGDKLVDGEPYFSLRDGTLDKKSSVQLHPYIAAYLYKFLHFFNRDITLMRALFLLPAILIGLALIPTFFIGRKIAGNTGGFFAAIFLAVNGPLLGRTPAGFADTDPYNILFPLIILWLFLEAYTSKNNYWKLLLIACSGFMLGVYSAIWTWAHVFYFVIGTLIIVTFLNLIYSFFFEKENIKKEWLKIGNIKSNLTFLLVFFVSSGIFISFALK